MLRLSPIVFVVLGAMALAACRTDEPRSSPGEPDAGRADAAGPDSAGPDATDDPDPDPDLPDQSAPWFAFDHVLEVDIRVDPEDWDTLRSQTRTIVDILGGDCLDGPRADIFDWFPATVTVDGERLDEVGIRKKGYLGSLSEEKPALKLRFDKYVEGQRLGGALERMTLNNVQQDASKMNTCLSYAVFVRAGVPTPRCNFAAVSVNGVDYGLYVHVESVREPFLARHFADPTGNLYEGTLSDFTAGWSGTFEKKTHESEADFSDIEAVVDALELPGEAGIAALGEVVDIDRFLTFWATEVLIAHWDGYSGNRNNFHIYREPGGRFVFIPWGADSAFAPRGDDGTPVAVMAAGAIAHRLYNDPQMRAAYVARMRALLDSAWDEGELTAMIDAMETILLDHALDHLLPGAAADSRRVRNFIATRRAAVQDALRGPEPWPWPLGAADICWAEIGELDVTFETTWGSLGTGDPLSVGDATIRVHTVEGRDTTWRRAGATMGIDPGDPNDPGSRPRVALTIYGLMDGDALDLLYIYFFDQRQLLAGGEVSLDLFRGDGLLLHLFPPRYDEPEFYGRLTGGTLTFDAAGTTPGAPVRGRVRGTIYEAR